MSGISSALGYYLIGLQSGKGVEPTTYRKYRACKAGTLAVNKTVNRYHITDDTRDMGNAFTSVVEASGDCHFYMHPDGTALPFYLALGGVPPSGSPAVIQPGSETLGTDDLPWFTVIRVVGNQLQEKFADCKAEGLKVEGVAGDAPEMSLSVVGINPGWEDSLPGFTDVVGDPFKYWEGKGRLLIDGSPFPWSKFDWEVKNNLLKYQADDYFLNDVDPGKREIDFNFTMHWQGIASEPKYREWVYDSDTGTTVSPALHPKSFEWSLYRDDQNFITVSMPQGRYAQIPIHEDPNGQPIEIQVATVVERQASGPIVTVTAAGEAIS